MTIKLVRPKPRPYEIGLRKTGLKTKGMPRRIKMQIAELKYTSQINIKGRSLSFNIRQKEEEEANSVLNFFLNIFLVYLFIYMNRKRVWGSLFNNI